MTNWTAAAVTIAATVAPAATRNTAAETRWRGARPADGTERGLGCAATSARSFDPAAAIDAQAQLISDLLGRFGSVALALAAYNAGPGAVEACTCVPPYPETQAYVARILALIGTAGGLAPELEVRLVE